MKKNKTAPESVAQKQRRQLAAKERRARRKEKLADLVQKKVRLLAAEIKNLKMQLTTKEREIEALKGAPANVGTEV